MKGSDYNAMRMRHDEYFRYVDDLQNQLTWVVMLADINTLCSTKSFIIEWFQFIRDFWKFSAICGKKKKLGYCTRTCCSCREDICTRNKSSKECSNRINESISRILNICPVAMWLDKMTCCSACYSSPEKPLIVFSMAQADPGHSCWKDWCSLVPGHLYLNSALD